MIVDCSLIRMLQKWSILFVSVWLVSCSERERRMDTVDADGADKIELVGEELDLGETIDQPINVVANRVGKNRFHVFQNNPDIVYTVDLDENVIVSSDTLTNGRGPGEFENAGNYTTNGKNIFITDRAGYSIDILDTSMVHTQTIQLSGMPVSLDVFEDVYLMASYVEFGQSKIELFDNKPIKTFLIPAESKEALFTIGTPLFWDESSIIFARTFSNEVFVIDILSGRLDKKTVSMLEERSKFEKERGVLMPQSALFMDIAKSDKYVYFLTGVKSEEGQLVLELIPPQLTINRLLYLDKDVNRFTVLNGTITAYAPIERAFFIYKL